MSPPVLSVIPRAIIDIHPDEEKSVRAIVAIRIILIDPFMMAKDSVKVFISANR